MRTGPVPVRGRNWPAAVGLAGLLAMATLVSMRPRLVGFIHDDGIYVAVAKSISEGTGHRIISLPGSPRETKYPFLYPYVLSWMWRLNPTFPDNVALLKSLNALCAFGAMLLGYQLFRRHTGRSGPWALTYAFLIGTNPVLVSFTDFTLSESLFQVFTLGALVLHDGSATIQTTARGDGRGGAAAPGPVWCGAVVASLGFLTRAVGASLIVAGVLHALFRLRRRDAMVYATLALAPALPWLIWRASAPAVTNPLLTYYTGYEDPAIGRFWSHPAEAWQIVSANARYLRSAIDDTFLLLAFPGVRWLIYPIVLLGIVEMLRRVPVFLLAFVAIYVAVILDHPFPPGRFVVPLVPVLLLFLFVGLFEIEARAPELTSGRVDRKLVTNLVRIPIALFMVLNVAWFAIYIRRSTDNPIRGLLGTQLPYGWNGFVETFDWIKNHTNERDILAAPLDPMYFLYTGRQGVRPWFPRPETYYYPYGHPAPDLGDPEKVRDALDALGVRYAVADPIEGVGPAAPLFFDRLLRAYAGRAQLVFVSGDSRHKIYALRPPSQAEPASR